MGVRKNTKNLTLYLMLLLLTGCTTTYNLGHDPGDVRAEEALSDMIGKECTVTLQDGSEDVATLVKWTRDTLVFARRDTGLPIPFPTDQVYCVKAKGSRVLGTIGGTLTGAGIGALVGSTKQSEIHHEGEWYSPWRYTYDERDNSILVGAGVGTLLGAAIGYSAFRNKTIVMFAAPGAEGFNALPQVIGVLVPALTGETDNFLIFSSEGKTIRLPKERMKFERRRDGIMIWATRWTFQSAGLILK